MKSWIFILLLIGCQDYNSNSSDKVRYDDIELVGDANFLNSYAIIQNRCVNCHTSQIHSSWSSYTSPELWIESGRVIPGDPDNSSLIYRIINHGGDMPLNGSPIPDTEYDTLVEWVESLESAP